MNGYDVCKGLKANLKTSDIPVVFLTTLHDRDFERLAIDVGAVGFIMRPFQPEQLRAEVHRLIG